jgi:F0F1-type ATP synthase membrane subunit c/vacuolar-type H+-ATPase subunit K
MTINLDFLAGNGLNDVAFGIFLAIAALLIGIVVGKVFAKILTKLAKKGELGKEVRPSFIGLIIVVIKWSIYIGALNVSLMLLPFPALSDLVNRVLIVVPAFTASLVLIGIGFAIAIYLREVVEDSEITGWKTLSQYLYYFVLYVFGVYAINIALISIDGFVRNWITVALTTVVAVALTYAVIKNEIKKS